MHSYCITTGTWQVDAVPAEGTYPVQCGGANGSFKKEIEEGQRLGFKVFGEQNGTLLHTLTQELSAENVLLYHTYCCHHHSDAALLVY
jgi:hypothetical protein